MAGLFFWPVVLFSFLCFLLEGQTLATTSPTSPELVIYAYDSFLAEGGLGPSLFPLFEKKFRCRVRALGAGDGVQLLTRIQLDAQRGKSVAQLVVGIDESTWKRAKPWLESWGAWTPRGYLQIRSEAQVEKGFLPYDYGALTWLADRKSLDELHLTIPSSFQDLLKPEWRRNIILEDPRTSTLGLNLLLFTDKIFGSSNPQFWTRFKSQWLTLTPGWEGAFGLFLRQEAPLVWSYITSQAYFEENTDLKGKQRRYQAILLKEGQPVQVEGAAWLKGAGKTQQQRLLAQNFLEFLISPEVQELVPRHNWMMPVLKNVKLPASYQQLPQPTRFISVSSDSQEIEKSLARWSRAVQ